MRLEGWIFLIASWSVILAVLVLCLVWTFRTRRRNNQTPGAE